MNALHHGYSIHVCTPQRDPLNLYPPLKPISVYLFNFFLIKTVFEPVHCKPAKSCSAPAGQISTDAITSS